MYFLIPPANRTTNHNTFRYQIANARDALREALGAQEAAERTWRERERLVAETRTEIRDSADWEGVLRKKREDLEKDLELILELVDTQTDQKVKRMILLWSPLDSRTSYPLLSHHHFILNISFVFHFLITFSLSNFSLLILSPPSSLSITYRIPWGGCEQRALPREISLL
jgi:hypothetical protein